MMQLDSLTRERPALIGMIHLEALPGTPRSVLSFDRIRMQAMQEARCLVETGFDALIVENMGDTPYLRRKVGPEIIAAMTTVVSEIVTLGIPVGVQILAGANEAAMAVAEVSGAQFIRAESFTYGHLADEGWMDADAGNLLRYRQEIGSEVRVFCDVQKKHSAHAVSADLSLSDWIDTAKFCGADGVVITGRMTGHAPEAGALDTLRTAQCPVFIGSGVTPDNVSEYYGVAHGLIVGSYLKESGHWTQPISKSRALEMRKAVDTLT